MSGIHFKKVPVDPKRILSRNCLGRTTLEKLLISAAIILLSGCIFFGFLYFTNLNSGDKEADTTTPTSVLGAAKESSGKDETEPGASVKETAAAADSIVTSVTDASDTDAGAAGETAKSTTKAATAAAAAGTNATTGAATSWSAATITPTTTAAESSFSQSDISIPADLGSFSTYSTDTDTSVSIPSDLDTGYFHFNSI